jgi:hypothetical protein
MPVHYAKTPGLPYCGDGVTDETLPRTRRWTATDGTRGKKKVPAQVETAQARAQVDCASCITQMDTDGIP